ncbi:MAG: metal ABC transporter permease [Synergistaceae bacterium]|nr:metal ABC transporter permease [Synergistaceae bacterium]
MTELLEKIVLYFEFPFVRNALIVGVLVSLCSSLLGVTLVLKRFSFIGDGLSHVAFGAMAIAAVLNITNNMPVCFP